MNSPELNTQKYDVECTFTRLQKGQIAPTGFIFYLLNYKSPGGKKYFSSRLVKMGKSESQQTDIFNQMWESLKKKYKL